MGTIFLWIVLLSLVLTFGTSQFYQSLPETCNVEQVFIPFSRIDKACDFHFNLNLDDLEFSTTPVYTDYQLILNAVNHSVSVVFQVQRFIEHSISGKIKSLRFIKYSSDYKDNDDVRV